MRLILLVICLSGCSFVDNQHHKIEASNIEKTINTKKTITKNKPKTQNAIKRHKNHSLNDCIAIALKNNRRIGIFDRRVLIAKDQVDGAWTRILPRLNVEARFAARNNDVGGNIGGINFVTGDRNVFTTNVSLIVPIYDFGVFSNRKEASEIGVEMAKLNAKKNHQDLIFSVSQSYFRVLETKKIQKVIKDSIKTITRQLAIAKDFWSQGVVAKTDVLSAEVQLAERQQELIQAENNYKIAQATLNRLMGIDISETIKIEDMLEKINWQVTSNDFAAIALRKRPDIIALNKKIEMLRSEHRAIRSELWPKVFAFGEYNYTSDDFILNDDWFAGGVGIKIPIFDGGQTYVQINSKDKEIIEAIDLKKEAIDDMALQIKRVLLRLDETVKRISVAEKNILLAEENLKVIREQYQQGLISNIDVLREEDRLARIRVNYYRTLYDAHTAFAELNNVIGYQIRGS